MNGINRFSLDAILIFDENFDVEIKNTLLKCDAILYDDEYWDIEIGFYPDLDKIYINTDNTVYHNTDLCRYYGIQYFYQWENLYFQDLVCCTFDNLGGGGQVNNCIIT